MAPSGASRTTADALQTGAGPVRWAVPAALAAATAALYLPLRHVPFVADDYPNLLHPWNFVAAASPEFRPLESLAFVAERAAFGLHALPWHLLGIALDASAVVSAWFLAHRLAAAGAGVRGPGAPAAAASVAAAIFLLDPRAVQAVVWPSAVGDLGYSLAFLLACLSWPRRPWLAAGLYAVALGFKEAAILLPLALACCDLRLLPGARAGERLRRLWPALGVGTLFGAFEAVRPRLLAALGDRAVFIYAVTGGYHLVGGPLLWRNLAAYPELTLFPWVAQTWALHRRPLLLLAAPAAALLGRWLLAGGLRRWGAVWIALTALPALLFAPFDVSDLYLYLPVFGLALALAAEVVPVDGPGRPPARVLAAAACAALLAAEGARFGALSAAWRRDGAAFARARAAIVAAAAAHPRADLVLQGLPSLRGEVYLWMDALPYAVALYVPGFRGRVIEGAPPAGRPAVVLRFAPDGALLPAPVPGRR